ncbi:MAG: Tfp pilus assembly protein FimT/FimU [Chthoniobacteraceae bacterium]
MNSKFSIFNRRGFSLVELLMILAIIVVILSIGVPHIIGILQGTAMTRNINELADCLRHARTAAISGNTYVWVGILPVSANAVDNPSGNAKIVVAAVAGKNGQTSDITSGCLTPIRKSRVLENVTLNQFDTSILQSAGRETTGVNDISASSLDAQFSLPIGGVSINGQPPVFTELIQFSPQGDAKITSTASRWIEIGLQAPHDKNGTNIAILQINGLTGQLRIFRP